MTNGTIALAISLFCDQDNWHQLIKEGILPIVTSLYSKKIILGYSIKFNQKQGENIRLILISEELQAESTATLIDYYFKNFFLNIDFSEKVVSFPVKSVFRPFPPNTIKYGLYPVVRLDSKRLNDYLNRDMALSVILARMMSYSIIDDEKVFTCGLYLHLALVKISLVHEIADLDRITFLYHFSGYKRVNAELIQAQYKLNKAMVDKMVSDIVATQEFTGSLEFLNGWILICENELKNTISKDFCEIEAFQLIELVNDHLGITGDLKIIISEFMKLIIPDMATCFTRQNPE